MRYEKAEQLLRLCVMMSSRLNGVTLEGIMSEFEVSRRTAERMRDAAIRLLPDVEEWLDADGRKHWRAAKLPAVMAALTTDEIAEVSIASEALRNSGRTASADMLDGLLEKLTAGQGKLTQARWEADLELLMESEGAAFRPGPRIAIGRKLLATLRHARGQRRGRARHPHPQGAVALGATLRDRRRAAAGPGQLCGQVQRLMAQAAPRVQDTRSDQGRAKSP